MEVICTFKLQLSDERVEKMRQTFGNERAVRDVVKDAVFNNVLNHIPQSGDAITVEALHVVSPLPENVIIFPAHRVRTKAALQPV